MMDIQKICPMCSARETMHVDKVKYFRWQAGELIQKVWPDKSPEWREQLKTGLCPKCQETIFAEPEE